MTHNAVREIYAEPHRTYTYVLANPSAACVHDLVAAPPPHGNSVPLHSATSHTYIPPAPILPFSPPLIQ